MLCPCRESRGKIHQAFWLHFCILQAIKNWSWERPGNEGMLAHFNSANNIHWVICTSFHVTCPTNSCPQSTLIHNQWYFFLLSLLLNKYVYVVGRNQTLFCCIFRLRYHVWCAVVKTHMYCVGTWIRGHFYASCMSPTLSGSSLLQHVEHGNAIKIHVCNRIIFDFYPGLPHVEKTPQKERNCLRWC